MNALTAIIGSGILAASLALGACSAAPDETGTAVRAPCPLTTARDYVWVPPATITIGDDQGLPEERPARSVPVDGFWIAAGEVTNAQFAEFVAATGYRTLAERNPPPIEGATADMLLPGSAVFTAPIAGSPQWWRWVVGAQWRHPRGPGSNLSGLGRHPVVQIAYDDALAYARWAGMTLPSEEQWESAAQQGGANPHEPVDASGRPLANYYQGIFPVRDMATDGYRGTAPTGCFPASQLGTYDMIGNVWEWTRSIGVRADADERVNIIKGGSYLCAANYCARYRPAARQFQERGLGTDHIGFRLVDERRRPPDKV
jgi:sulfatase modifying factor 1